MTEGLFCDSLIHFSESVQYAFRFSEPVQDIYINPYVHVVQLFKYYLCSNLSFVFLKCICAMPFLMVCDDSVVCKCNVINWQDLWNNTISFLLVHKWLNDDECGTNALRISSNESFKITCLKV